MSFRPLDTNIVSYRFKLAGYALAVSFQTIGELWEWAERNGWGPAERARLEAAIESFTVIESDPEICREWARVRVARRHQPISTDDAWIAATALVYGMELVTHNPADFAGVPNLAVIAEGP